MSRIKTKDAELAAQVSNFVESMSPGLLTQAGVSTAEYTAVTNGSTAFRGNLENVLLTESSYRGAVQEKDAQKRTLTSSFRVVIDKLYATPSITNAQLASVGLPPRSGTPLPTPPVTVNNLRVGPQASGAALLRWSRNGNAGTTIYLIEASIENGPFVQIGQTLRIRFTDENATPGVMKTYRVVSFNALGRSAPSTAVTIYPDEGSGQLEVAA